MYANHFSTTQYGAWHESKDYIRWVINNISEMFEFKKSDIFVDIGGGTGFYTSSISQKAKLFNKAKGYSHNYACP